jgi:hypothetical protein
MILTGLRFHYPIETRVYEISDSRREDLRDDCGAQNKFARLHTAGTAKPEQPDTPIRLTEWSTSISVIGFNEFSRESLHNATHFGSGVALFLIQ